MNEKNTDTLQQELMSTNNLDRFLTENDASFRDVPLQEAIQRIFDEIADQLALSSNTVKSRFYAALDKLRVQLEVTDVGQSANF